MSSTGRRFTWFRWVCDTCGQADDACVNLRRRIGLALWRIGCRRLSLRVYPLSWEAFS